MTSSGCVQAMLCGPPSTGTSLTSSISSGRRAAVASKGRIRSSVPWTTSTGTSIFGRSPRKSVSHVSTHAYEANGDAAGGDVEARLPRLLADPLRHQLVDVVEVVEEVLEPGVAVLGDRSLDLLEDLSVDALRVVVRLQQVRRDRTEQRGLAHPCRSVATQVPRHLAAPHREPDEDDVVQVEMLEQRVEVGGEGVVVVADGRLARAAEPAPVVADHAIAASRAARAPVAPTSSRSADSRGSTRRARRRRDPRSGSRSARRSRCRLSDGASCSPFVCLRRAQERVAARLGAGHRA